MELKEGMYVRTPYGIRKIKKITKDDGYGKPRVKVIELDWLLHTNYKFDYIFYTDEKIIKQSKASNNIIDLIEVGDYVNGYCVTEIFGNNRKKKPSTLIYCGYEIDNRFYYIGFYNEQIETIITKEQILQMQYKISLEG